MRPFSKPARLAATWTNKNPLTAPRAVLPLGAGLTALVLDGTGSSRLLEVVLATGKLVRTVASGLMGMPTALAFEGPCAI